MPTHSLKGRSNTGAALVVLVFVLAIFVVGVFGVFSFEITRVNTAKQELQHVCEATALAAAQAMPNPWTYMEPDTWYGLHGDAAYGDAEKAGQQVFISNNVLGTWLANTTFSDNRNSSAEQAKHANPAANDACMYIEFLKNDGTPDDWLPQTPLAVKVHVIGTFCEVPSFGRYCGIDKAVVLGDATAPIPWIHTFRSDWHWRNNTDWSDGGVWQLGQIGEIPADPLPNPYVQNGILYLPQTPGGFISTYGRAGIANPTPFRQRYGYFQAMVKQPVGSWTKFWLHDWRMQPVYPRIDVYDSNSGGDKQRYYAVLHRSSNGLNNAVETLTVDTGKDLSTAFHAYGIIWLPDDQSLYFLLDHKLVGKLQKYTSTDLEQLQPVLGNTSDVGPGGTAQVSSVDIWQMGYAFNPTNNIPW